MDVVVAIEGGVHPFDCAEIRQRGVGGGGRDAGAFDKPCGISIAMRRAELAWRRELAAQTIADLLRTAPNESAARARREYARMAK